GGWAGRYHRRGHPQARRREGPGRGRSDLRRLGRRGGRHLRARGPRGAAPPRGALRGHPQPRPVGAPPNPFRRGRGDDPPAPEAQPDRARRRPAVLRRPGHRRRRASGHGAARGRDRGECATGGDGLRYLALRHTLILALLLWAGAARAAGGDYALDSKEWNGLADFATLAAGAGLTLEARSEVAWRDIGPNDVLFIVYPTA